MGNVCLYVLRFNCVFELFTNVCLGNTNLPDITQTNLVNIYLFHGDSGQQILQMLNHTNPRGLVGSVTAQVNDSWFPNGGLGWSDSNISYPYFWVITRADVGLDGRQIPQSTFSAVQTTFADAVTSSRASASSVAAASSSSVAASLSSQSVQSSLSASTATANPNGTVSPSASSATPSGNLQSDGGSNFPHWAIAVIVVLGFLAIVASCVLVFLIARRIRRRRISSRNSMGSASPMMANVQSGQGPQSPLMEQAGQQSSFARAPSLNSRDGASTVSHTHSAGDAAPFSGADAAIMANAFRQALRKPDFAAPPIEEGESPDTQDRHDAQLLSRELAEEGRDIRSVSSSRGVRVETLSDADGEGTVQDHPR
ncbi:hypothetical protein EWM64_g2098 [Hericium alpestre]|uniref:Uncharacterized protein n=1 Tax=Hericium alpestre TaxID=135208 RepID=A0A4Z0A627_9AGAM|nr:hypothetical protein EWM64_g2098 [Hericium alpestre]